MVLRVCERLPLVLAAVQAEVVTAQQQQGVKVEQAAAAAVMRKAGLM
jgi:hypothetical protein